MNLGEFIVKLGFSADTLKVKEFVKAIGDLPVEAASAIAALAGVEYELVKIAQQAMESAVGFDAFRAQTGLSWKELQKWEIVAAQANVSAEAVASSVTALQRNLAEIRLGRGNIAPFQLLGIGVNQNAFQVLEQIRQRIRGLDRATATNILTQMGLSPEMISVLGLSDKQFAHFAKTVSGMTGEQEASFLRMKLALTQFGLAAKEVGVTYVDHLVGGLTALINTIKSLNLWMPGLITAAAALAIAWAPTTAGILALMLVLDDLAVYFQGGDSVIGLAIEGLKKLGEALKQNLSGLSTLGKLATAGSFLANPLGTAGGLIGNAVTKVVNQHNNISVHSTAPAHEVGKAVKEHIDKGVSAAALQTDNQGY